jgi:hypothetical protein
MWLKLRFLNDHNEIMLKEKSKRPVNTGRLLS